MQINGKPSGGAAERDARSRNNSVCIEVIMCNDEVDCSRAAASGFTVFTADGESSSRPL